MSMDKPRWARRKDARPKELLAAALDLFEERGFASTRLEDVARRAGVSKGTLYLYFSNKEDLFEKVVRDSLRAAMVDADGHAEDSSVHSADLLCEVMVNWWQRIRASRMSSTLKVLAAEARNFPELVALYNDQVLERSARLIGGVVARGVHCGEFSEVDPEQTAHVLISPLLALMSCQPHFFPYNQSGFDSDIFLRSFLRLTLLKMRSQVPQPFSTYSES
ncbi:TetR/AcrR family transcriptional regulator [Duganella sp. PWIR1]